MSTTAALEARLKAFLPQIALANEKLYSSNDGGGDDNAKGAAAVDLVIDGNLKRVEEGTNCLFVPRLSLERILNARRFAPREGALITNFH